MSNALARDWGYYIATAKRRTSPKRRDFQRGKIMSPTAGMMKLDFKKGIFMLAIGAFLLGTFYLYQINSIATRGYEIRDIENNIQDMQKAKKKLEIEEVEFRSMYNIEKSMKDLNLVTSPDITYMEMDSPVAMK